MGYSPQRQVRYNTNKRLPMVPTSTDHDPQQDLSKQLQMIDESFEDVTLNLDLEKFQSKHCNRYTRGSNFNASRPYGNANYSNGSVSKFHSNDRLLSAPKGSPPKQQQLAQRPHSHPAARQQSQPVILTASQRLRIRRKQANADLESSIRHEHEILNSKGKDVDSLSDDELPDDFIVYNVPLSKSLKALSHKEQYIMNQPFTNRFQLQHSASVPLATTDATVTAPNSHMLAVPTSASSPALSSGPRTSSSLSESNRSSIFSYNSTISNITDDNLSFDAKFFTIELNKSMEMIQQEESQQRIFQLKKLMQQQNYSRESVYSNASNSSLVSDSTSKFLSNTRPNNLPPKDRYESLKHAKDYEMILNNAVRQESHKCNAQSQYMRANERQKEKDTAMWNEISNNLKENLSKTSTRELWWRGIPAEFRAKIWCEQIGNKLQISTDDATSLLQSSVLHNSDHEALVQNITLYCFPNLLFAKKNLTALVKMVHSYSRFTEIPIKELDAGVYSLAATLLYNIKSLPKSFIALCNILHRKLPYLLLHGDIQDEFVTSQIASFDRIFQRKLNRVFTHFKIYGLNSVEFLKPMCSYCMTQYMELSKASKLVDIYLFEGDSFLLRCALAFLKKIDYKLFGSKQEIMQILGDQCLVNLNQDLFRNDGKKAVNQELIYGFKYLDLGLDQEFLQCVRNILRD